MIRTCILIAALIAGALLSLSFAPYDYWYAALISIAIYALLLNLPHNDVPSLTGTAYGLGLFGSGSSWVYYSIHDYGGASVVLALLLVTLFTLALSLFHTLFGYLFGRFRQRIKHPLIVFALLWVLMEWLRSWAFSGFPWLYLGYAFSDTWLAAWAPLFGIYGVSFAAVLCVISAGYCCHKKTFLAGASSLILILAMSQTLNSIEWTKPAGEQISVGIVQPNISLHDKWDKSKFRHHIAQLSGQTRLVEDSDIIVWPEAAIPGNYPAYRVLVEHLIKQAQFRGYTLIAGMPYREQQGANQSSYYNSQWVSPEVGLSPQFYLKQHLVPFGEYVPLESLLRGLIDFFDLPSSYFSVGPKKQPQIYAGKLPVAIAICYEIAFPDLVAQNLGQSTLLFTVSNDAWFGSSIGPAQHFQIAAMRARELSRPLVRATNNGISGGIDHRGRTVVKSAQFVETQFSYRVQPHAGFTPFALTGSKPFIIALAIALSAMVADAYWRRKS